MLAKIFLALWEARVIEATMFRAKTQLSDLVKRAQRGEKIVLTQGRKKTPVAEIVAVKPVKERAFDLFPHPDFDIPADFDELPEPEMKGWRGEGE
jgi:antitoxin (DNA-binding transcriptional repressor) of toxin-antitoxin stability system